jgi:hypothetical protein
MPDNALFNGPNDCCRLNGTNSNRNILQNEGLVGYACLYMTGKKGE